MGRYELTAAHGRLTEPQRRALVDLADVRDAGNTGEAYSYPSGSQYATARVLARLGFIKLASLSFQSVYMLTDAGYEEARRVAA
jgi:hypothetical protein